MSVLKDTSNQMPGVLIDYEQETSQDYDPSLFGTTDSVLLIGTAFSGQPGIAAKVYNGDMGRYYYGKPYDNATQKSATLSAAIQDAYDHGARTMYAMRLGGIPITKDFQFCDENFDFRIRLSSLYPSNISKECYMLLNLAPGLESITFYKPADKATILEQKMGMVASPTCTMVNKIELNIDHGLNVDSALIDVIKVFNEHVFNNVLRLSIVDRDGNDVTSEDDVKDICLGSMFAGVYFIGRDKSNCSSYTKLDTHIIIDDTVDAKPYKTYKGHFFKDLIFNSDVYTEYPIYAQDYSVLQKTLLNAGVTSSELYDFLAVTGACDKVFLLDDKDYEETNLSPFQIYKRLGCGFASTAMAVSRGVDSKGRMRRPRIVDTPADNPNNIVYLKDGLYDILQDAEIKYRVLSCGNADDKIEDPMPTADDFRIASANTIPLLGNLDGAGALMVAKSKVNENDLTAPLHFDFKFEAISESSVAEDIISKIYTKKVAHLTGSVNMDPKVDKNVTDTIKRTLSGTPFNAGYYIMILDEKKQGHLIRTSNNGNFIVLNNAGMVDELFYVGDVMYVGQYDKAAQETIFVPLAADAPATGKAPGLTDISHASKETETVPNSDKTTANNKLSSPEKSPSKPNSAATMVAATIDASTVATAAIAQSKTFKGFEYFLIESDNSIYVMHIVQDSQPQVTLDPIGDLVTLLGSNAEETVIYAEKAPLRNNHIVVTTAGMDFMSLDEFCTYLNKHHSLGRMFSFELTNLGRTKKDHYLEDIETITLDGKDVRTTTSFFHIEEKEQGGLLYTMAADRDLIYDFNKYIPYKTSDNFARHMAQHCAYTTLRTSTTCGFVGMRYQSDTSLAAIEQRVETLKAKNWQMYAKHKQGHNMLGHDKMPYDIGMNVYVPVMQYGLVDDDGNTAIVNGAAGIAGLVSSLPITESITMRPYVAGTGTQYTFSSSQIMEMSAIGFMVLRPSAIRGLCIADGTSMALPNKLTKSLAVTRAMDYCGDLIRIASEPYLSKMNSIANRNSLHTAIDSALNTKAKNIVINDYKFTIRNLDSYTDDGFIDISYEIFPMNEIRAINNSIRIVRKMQR